MIYELRATLFFRTPDPCGDIMDKILDHFDDAIVVKPGELDQQCSSFDLLECRHDQTPVAPCTLVDHKDNCPSP